MQKFGQLHSATIWSVTLCYNLVSNTLLQWMQKFGLFKLSSSDFFFGNNENPPVMDSNLLVPWHPLLRGLTEEEKKDILGRLRGNSLSLTLLVHQIPDTRYQMMSL